MTLCLTTSLVSELKRNFVDVVINEILSISKLDAIDFVSWNHNAL